jgi:hypothetical protein
MTNPTTYFGWQMPTSTDLVTDLPADFEVFGQAVDTDFQDLLGGTTGQVLKKNTNANLDFVWAADTAGMTNPMTTTGDMIYASSGSTPARLGIGTTGQVLNVTGGIPAWSTPSAGWTLITSGSLSSTTTTVSSISGAFLDLKILFIGMVPSTAGASISITYNNTNNIYNPGIIFTDGTDTFDAASAAATANKIGNNMATTGTTNSVQILMQDYSRVTGYKRAEITFWNARNTGNSHWGWYEQRAAISDAINRFDVTATAGTLSGSYFVYGL